jgi:methylmalonyl-CoA/ethylmalonyl-CoA epimerase
MIFGIDHVGIAVRSDAAAGTFETLLGAGGSEAAALPDHALRVCFIPPTAPNLELLAPTDTTGPVARFLERRGEGLHHVCFAVDDIAAELHRLIAAGFEPIDAQPREGNGGLVAFLHPRTSHGVLVELLQKRT